MQPEKDYNLMVGLRIREIRESLDMTRAQFASLCDISESFLTAVERGQKSITSKTIYKICSSSKVTADYLIFGRNNGYEMDVLLELFNGLDENFQEPAVHILSEYCKAIQKSRKEEQ